MEHQRWIEGPPDVNEDVLDFLQWLEFPHQQQHLQEQDLEAQPRHAGLLQSGFGGLLLQLTGLLGFSCLHLCSGDASAFHLAPDTNRHRAHTAPWAGELLDS
mmetsp:Transcript_20259/g.52645  ORF Transcript_20259/g.52645 Transcript_20259/m.52645 type:complete len:102 (+) Transcript_20259:27-332(+)